MSSQFQQLNEQKKELSDQDTGILSGEITLASGNCMPMVCDYPSCPSSCRIEGVSRNMYVREVATIENMNITSLKKNKKPVLVKTLTSNIDGSYTIILPVGKYSIFVEDDDKEYCNSFDGQGTPCMVEVKKDQTTEYNFQIDHAVW